MVRTTAGTFYGWRVVGAAFLLAVIGWGVGFYGPPIFLSTLHESKGWPVALVSAAVTEHFLAGAIASANLPALYRRFGAGTVTKAGGLSLALGAVGWAGALSPWQLFVASLVSGFGWGTTSAAALNAILSPWFERTRPAALAMAYNGASIGGVIFSPLWAAAVGAFGFATAAMMIGAAVAMGTWILADLYFCETPSRLGLTPDGGVLSEPAAAHVPRLVTKPLPGSLLWRDRKFLTLAAGMGLGLFAQIGLTAHLFSLLVPAFGAQGAGLAMSLITATAVVGRTLLGWLMPANADRRRIASYSYAAQLAGSLVLIAAAGSSVPLLLLGIVLFGVGFGNATSLPPLIAQVEFVKQDVVRVVALIVGLSQSFYAFAPATFGLIRDLAPQPAACVFAAAALAQALAILAMLAGRRG